MGKMLNSCTIERQPLVNRIPVARMHWGKALWDVWPYRESFLMAWYLPWPMRDFTLFIVTPVKGDLPWTLLVFCHPRSGGLCPYKYGCFFLFVFFTLWEQFLRKSKENLTSNCVGDSGGWIHWRLWRLKMSGAEAFLFFFFAGWCSKWVKDDNSSRREMPSPTLLPENAGIWDPVMLWNMSAMQMSSFYYLHVFIDWHLASGCILRTPDLSLDREVEASPPGPL